MTNSRERQPVLILGAGINGCSLARELVLNRVPVWVVDTNDLAFGATSKSSRLIHGGLRYLEYGDLRLVRESLRERSRLRRLAPHFVEPLELCIPVSRRTGGLFLAALRFLGASGSAIGRRLMARLARRRPRGLWVARLGLWMYDRLVRDPQFPGHRVYSAGAPQAPSVDRSRYRWLCAYTDGRMQYPERFVVALLEDARQAAVENGTEFRVLTYHRAELRDGEAEIHSKADVASHSVADRPPRSSGLPSSGEAASAEASANPVHRLRPSLVVNATGAWGDLTLDELHVESPRLFGGTKGSHFVTHHPGLREALGEKGVYAEAADGRLIFVLPFAQAVLVGTTDEPFAEPPERAVASQHELEYLLGMANELFPHVRLSEGDIDMHYSGVRPLPSVPAAAVPAAVSRDHWIVPHERAGIPILTLVGGKLTTARAFAEEVADRVFERLSVERTADTRDRPIAGGRDYPADAESLRREWDSLAKRFGLPAARVREMWALCGNRAGEILDKIDELSPECLSGTDLPLDYVRWVIAQEWVTTLDDLVERRLMLLYHPRLTEAMLRQLARCLVEADRLEPAQADAAVRATTARLREHYGKKSFSA